MAEPVRARRLTDQEVQELQQIVCRGSTSSVRYRRAMMRLVPAGGNRAPVIVQPIQTEQDAVRDVIHRFNGIGLACLDPRWAGTPPDLCLLDQPDRGPVRPAAPEHPGQLPPSQPPPQTRPCNLGRADAWPMLTTSACSPLNARNVPAFAVGGASAGVDGPLATVV